MESGQETLPLVQSTQSVNTALKADIEVKVRAFGDVLLK